MRDFKTDYSGLSAKKGEYEGICARSACDNKNAKFFNRSTLKYYCSYDAAVINKDNKLDSMRLFGDPKLCVYINEEDAEKRADLEYHLSYKCKP